MILFSLHCVHRHEFEVWFRDGAAYDRQAAAGEIVCPFCGDHQVRKAPMAPNLVKQGRGEKPAPPPAAAPSADEAATPPPATEGDPPPAEAVRAVLTLLRQHVEQTCDNVGNQFPEEARRIHYGEAPKRGIYGNASDREARALHDEGVDVTLLPWLRSQDS